MQHLHRLYYHTIKISPHRAGTALVPATDQLLPMAAMMSEPHPPTACPCHVVWPDP